MTPLKTNRIWGDYSTIEPEETAFRRPRAPKPLSIRRQLHAFLNRQIKEWQPDKILVVERKGTAILRALKEWAEEPLDWKWNNVISSEAIDQVGGDYFQNQKVLVFDDMMRTGRHIQVVKDELIKRGLWLPGQDNFRFAIFAVHQISSIHDRTPDAWYYWDLSPREYEQIREEIIRMLQQAGSLMLDTEHLEVRVQRKCSENRFFSVLGRRAKAAVFSSLGQRANVTVLYGEDDEAYDLPLDLFPVGTDISGIVKKCRVIYREKNEYALIPICYPSVPINSSEWPSDSEMVELLGTGVKTDRGRFYAVGLLAALQVLHFVLKDLAFLQPTEYEISLPKLPAEANTRGGYSLDHLKVVFPTLNLENLTHRIYEIYMAATSEASSLRKRKIECPAPRIFTDEGLHWDAIHLLQVIRRVLDDKIAEKFFSRGEINVPHPFGLTAKQIFSLAKERLSWEDLRTSVLFDFMIDEAYLVPDVEPRLDEHGFKRMVRTFEPDGEVINEWIRNYTIQWSMPNGF